MDRSKKYNNTKLALGIVQTLLIPAFSFLYVSGGFSRYVYDFSLQVISYPLPGFLIFILLSFAGLYVILLPLSFYSYYILEHKYGLSNQTLPKYVLENLKVMTVSLLFGVPVILVFYYVINYYGSAWWLPFAVFMFLFSVVLSQIVPVFILPLFYKIKPVDDPALRESIKKLGKDAGLSVVNVFSFDMSKNTKKANAAFTGIGKSKRVLLGDNLLRDYTSDEIETVLAHEFGHYIHRHVMKNLIVGTVFSFLQLYLVSVLYQYFSVKFGTGSILYPPDMPLLIAAGFLPSLFFTPAGNMLSRRFEYQADNYAVAATGKTEAFISALNKLTEQNLGDKDPHPFIEWYFYSHPPLGKRIASLGTSHSLK